MSTVQITPSHLARKAAIYVRQSSPGQVLHNRESQRLQYGLVDRAVSLGWPRSQVIMIDEDLGVSGRGQGITRIGFDRLVAEVGLGHIGIVVSIEVSRVARNNRDWYHLLDLCALVDTLIADADGLYHPAAINDRLLLGLKGTISEFELHLIRSRLNGGLWEAARRGALRTHLPIGYQHDHDGRIVKVADEAIRETLALIFSKFAELGSARQVTAYLAEEGVLLPHRRVNDDAVSWRRATYALVHGVLTNPSYAGVYAYGRSKVERRFDDDGRLHCRQVELPMSDWAVLIPNHHDGFIALDVFEANQQRLRANLRAPRGDAGAAVREGAGLLQGLLRCGRCGRRMQITYTGVGRNVSRYACFQARRRQATERECQGLGGLRLEEHIVDAFLAALAPASIDATLAALHETEENWQRECRQRELAVERAGYEAERAERQFTRLEPENRLVARSLERAWEDRLKDAAECQEELDGFRRRRPTPLGHDDAEWLRWAGSDLKAVGQAPTTTNRDRKHLLRCLISEVVVFVDRERLVADLTIRWAGGASTKLMSPLNRTGGHRYVTSEQVNELVRQLAPYYSDEQIAFMLNMKHLRTGRGNSFTTARVGSLRRALGLPAANPASLPDSNDPSWMSVNHAAQTLAVSPDTIRHWAREGSLEAKQVLPQAPWRIHVTDEVVARMVPDAPDGWVGLNEAAKALGRAKQTILHWVHSGKMRSVQVRSGKRSGLRIELQRNEIGLFAEAN
jgi:DNA invertase Pin-like site-specific DNA recombinase